MSGHSDDNDLAGRAERLIHLVEELAEVTKAVSKATRFGMNDIAPGKTMTNRQKLEHEIGNVLYAINLLIHANDIRPEEILAGQRDKGAKARIWLRHQKSFPLYFDFPVSPKG